MRTLLLVQAKQRIILDRFYDSIVRNGKDCELRRLSSEQQDNLRRYFADVDTSSYDRIVLFLRFKKEIRQRRFLRTLPNLVILEHDAYQNYAQGKYHGEFSRHYRALPWSRIICSGYVLAERLRDEGFDAVFVGKGYDQQLLANLKQPRDIELGFLGSIESRIYSRRKELLEQLASRENLLIKRTQSGEEYAQMLNRIRYFISADVGMGEYMIKNFEAMACGCVVLAWNQGAAENAGLGLRDMENIVLYESLHELQQKLGQLRASPGLADSIAAAGQALVEQHYSWEKLGARVVEVMQPPLRQKISRTTFGIKQLTWAPPK
jgi:glycosyltransferase involved in cell wall biosynthesis